MSLSSPAVLYFLSRIEPTVVLQPLPPPPPPFPPPPTHHRDGVLLRVERYNVDVSQLLEVLVRIAEDFADSLDAQLNRFRQGPKTNIEQRQPTTETTTSRTKRETKKFFFNGGRVREIKGEKNDATSLGVCVCVHLRAWVQLLCGCQYK